MHDVARAFNMRAHSIEDDPDSIKNALSNVFEQPMLLNIETHRKFWHSGAGIDDENIFDRYLDQMNMIGTPANKIHKETKDKVEQLWQKQLDKQ